MKWMRIIAVVAWVLAVALPGFGGEVAVLRNGFSINFERKEVRGDITRLYLGGGYVDVPSANIESFETAPDDPPEPPATQPAANNTPAVNPSATNPSIAQTASVQPAGSTLPPNGAFDLDQVVRDASSKYRIDPDFVNSVIKAESNFKVHAVSPKGAQGLMQLMPATAAQLGVSNAFDPKANVEAGTAYLSYLLD